MSFSFSLIILLMVLSYRASKVTADNSYYTAGVVEFKPSIFGMNSSQIMNDHLNSYINIIESQEASDTDIIVFPEGTLNSLFYLTYVPSEKEQIIPCLTLNNEKYAEFFKQLSCAARKSRKYLVINLTEKENCPSSPQDTRPCASNNLNIFNTNVVFDREGRVVSRYRKVHVYVENKNTTLAPEFAIFETDFGVRFGHFICFDMLFYTPAQELVDRFGVTDLIFTSLFYSELPFLTAVQLQHGWAWGNKVNLLSAGASYPEWGMTGSGIYSGELGALVSVMASEDGERKLYKAKVPKKGSKLIMESKKEITNKPRALTKLKLLKDPQIENYNSLIVDFQHNESILKKKLCDGDVCCSFEINAKILNETQGMEFKYRLGIFDGRRTYEKEEWSDIKVCALYACSSEEVKTCGEPVLTDNVLFNKINIKGEFPNGNKLMIMPSIINDQLYNLNHDEVKWTKLMKRQGYEVNLELLKGQSSILTFGIYGQYYEKSSSLANTSGVTLIFICFILSSMLIVM